MTPQIPGQPKPKYYIQGSNLVFLSLPIGIVNICFAFDDIFSGSGMGAGFFILVALAVIGVSFIIPAAAAGMLRAGSRAGLALLLIHFIIGIMFFGSFGLKMEFEPWFYVIRVLQTGLQLWAIILVLTGQARDENAKAKAAETEKLD